MTGDPGGGGGETFTVSATVMGLQGTGLVVSLSSNALSASVDLPVTQNASVTFDAPLATGTTYAITIKNQPSAPAQTCTVSGGSGTIGSASVTTVVINCALTQFTIGGTVTGLDGGSVGLQLAGGDTVSVSGNQTFAFTTTRAQGAMYSVTISSQPVGQTCEIAGGSGQMGASNVTTIVVNCAVSNYLVSGMVSGLEGSGLVLQLNGGADAIISGNGMFAFSMPLVHGTPYVVTVRTMPDGQPVSPWQTCVVDPATASGTANDDVVDIAVDCTTNTYLVAGVIHGLAIETDPTATGLTLRLNGMHSLPIADAPNDDLAFAFTGHEVPSGSNYLVEITNQPDHPLLQSCTVQNPMGPVSNNGIVVHVYCEPAYRVSFTYVGAFGMGESASVSLGNGESVPVSTAGSYEFSTRFVSNDTYEVTVVPVVGQTCEVLGGTGQIAHGDIASVVVSCGVGGPSSFFVSGGVTGLLGSDLRLLLSDPNLGNPDLEVTIGGNGTFAFNQARGDATDYVVTVSNQPTELWQTCTVNNPSGAIAGASVTDIVVECVTNSYELNIGVVGVSGSGLSLRYASVPETRTISVPSDGTYTVTDILSGTSFVVSVQDQPTSPWQTCVLLGPGSQRFTSSDLGTTVSCSTNVYTLSGQVDGLVGTLELVLGSDPPLVVDGSTPNFAFAPLPSLSNYTLSVQNAPPGQRCTLNRTSGQITSANVGDLVVTCVDSFAISGTVSNQAGPLDVALQLGGVSAGSINIGALDSSFVFGAKGISGESYLATVTNNPAGQRCRVTNGAGIMPAAAVGNLDISCLTANPLSVAVAGLMTDTSVEVTIAETSESLVFTSVNQATPQTFPSWLVAGDGYDVSVSAQPTDPWQTCSVDGGGVGMMPNGSYQLNVTCTVNTYDVGVQVSGTAGQTLGFSLNGGMALSLSSDGLLPLGNLASGLAYSVVQSSFGAPGNERVCSIASAAGQVTNTSLALSTTCSPAFYVGVEVVGLMGGSGVTFALGAQTIHLDADGTLDFSTPMADASSYAVTIAQQPTNRDCSLSGDIGTIMGANSKVTVTCVPITLSGVLVRGNAEGVTINVSGSVPATLSLSADGAFSLPTEFTRGDVLAVTATVTSTAGALPCLLRRVGDATPDGNGLIDHQSYAVTMTSSISNLRVSCPIYVGGTSPATTIPDGVGTSCITTTPGSTFVTLSVAETFALQGVAVGMSLTHTWPGDLSAEVTRPGGSAVSVFARPGSGNCGSSADINGLGVRFDEQSVSSFSSNIVAGTHFPNVRSGTTSLRSNFSPGIIGQSATGTWTVTVYDHVQDDFGSFANVSLILWPAHAP